MPKLSANLSMMEEVTYARVLEPVSAFGNRTLYGVS